MCTYSDVDLGRKEGREREMLNSHSAGAVGAAVVGIPVGVGIGALAAIPALWYGPPTPSGIIHSVFI